MAVLLQHDLHSVRTYRKKQVITRKRKRELCQAATHQSQLGNGESPAF